MFVLLLFTPTLGFNLTQFNSFQVEFNAKCAYYLLLQNKSNYLSLFHRNDQFELWLLQNNETYEFYTAPYSQKFTFNWPEKHLNGVKMRLVLHQGWISYPMDFDYENIACPITGINTIVQKEEEVEKVFKCLPSEDWIINILIVGIVVLLIILFGVQHEFIKVILGPKISWIVWRVRKILSRSQEEISSCNSSTDWEISEIEERLHTPQTNTQTTKI